MSEQTSTLKNMLERCWAIVKNIVKHGPAAVLRMVWKIARASYTAGVWVVRMTGLLLWRSFWWTVGTALRARGVKTVEKPRRQAVMVSSDESSDESSCSVSSASSASSVGSGRKVRKTMHQRARTGVMIGAMIKSASTGEEWGYIMGETRDQMAWRLNTGKVVRKDSKKWKCVDAVTQSRNRPQRGCENTIPRKITVGSAEEAVAMLSAHKGRRPLEITVRSAVE